MESSQSLLLDDPINSFGNALDQPASNQSGLHFVTENDMIVERENPELKRNADQLHKDHNKKKKALPSRVIEARNQRAKIQNGVANKFSKAFADSNSTVQTAARKIHSMMSSIRQTRSAYMERNQKSPSRSRRNEDSDHNLINHSNIIDGYDFCKGESSIARRISKDFHKKEDIDIPPRDKKDMHENDDAESIVSDLGDFEWSDDNEDE